MLAAFTSTQHSTKVQGTVFTNHHGMRQRTNSHKTTNMQSTTETIDVTCPAVH